MLFFLARLLPAVTSASVATFFFFSRVFMFGDINNLISYTDLT